MSILPSKNPKSDLSADEDSIELMIQPQNKNFLIKTDFDIKYKEDERGLDFYIELDTKNINELIKETMRGRGFDDERKHIKNCIFFKKIETPSSGIKGNFHITYLAYKGLSFNVFLNSEEVDRFYFCKTQFNFLNQDRWRNRWVYGSV